MVLEVPQPLNACSVHVGCAEASFSVSPYHFGCEDGAPVPPFASNETVYDGFAGTETEMVTVLSHVSCVDVSCIHTLSGAFFVWAECVLVHWSQWVMLPLLLLVPAAIVTMALPSVG